VLSGIRARHLRPIGDADHRQPRGSIFPGPTGPLPGGHRWTCPAASKTRTVPTDQVVRVFTVLPQADVGRHSDGGCSVGPILKHRTGSRYLYSERYSGQSLPTHFGQCILSTADHFDEAMHGKCSRVKSLLPVSKT
jgi:hypothetical protein